MSLNGITVGVILAVLSQVSLYCLCRLILSKLGEQGGPGVGVVGLLVAPSVGTFVGEV
jgi:hypothetical protein